MERAAVTTWREYLTGFEMVVAIFTIVGVVIMSIKKVYRIARNVEQALNTIKRVQAQVEPNGGNSLHDRIVRLTADVAENQRIAADVAGKLHDVNERMSTIEGAHASCEHFEPRHRRRSTDEA